jgi:hypothetical protein
MDSFSVYFTVSVINIDPILIYFIVDTDWIDLSYWQIRTKGLSPIDWLIKMSDQITLNFIYSQ